MEHLRCALLSSLVDDISKSLPGKKLQLQPCAWHEIPGEGMKRLKISKQQDYPPGGRSLGSHYIVPLGL
jgi:hypothetical protein